MGVGEEPLGANWSAFKPALDKEAPLPEPPIRARSGSQSEGSQNPDKGQAKKKSFYLVGKPYFVISNLAERDHPIPLSVIANCSWNARSMIS